MAVSGPHEPGTPEMPAVACTDGGGENIFFRAHCTPAFPGTGPRDRDPNTADTNLKSRLSRLVTLGVGLLTGLSALAACGSQPEGNGAARAPLARTAWLGSAEGWGLLGLPLEGGPLTYRNAENLEAPTWAPPDLPAVARAWPGEGSIWLQFKDANVARYHYATGHLLNFEGFPEAEAAVALESGSGLVIAPGGRRLQRVAEAESWRVSLPGRLTRLVGAGGARVVVVVDSASVSEILVFEPPEKEPRGRRSVSGVRDVVVAPWGDKLYHLSVGEAGPAVQGLTLPALEGAEEFPLKAPGQALAITPSGHRLYVAVGPRLHVFDRVDGKRRRPLDLPTAPSALRFSLNGSHLLARLDGDPGEIAVLQVGIDALLGVVPGDWDADLPQGISGGRLILRSGRQLVLYDMTRLLEITREEPEGAHRWLMVNWQPPRPRIELAQRTARSGEAAAGPGAAEAQPGGAEAPGEERVAPPGYYAVVSAAREPAGVRNLVAWLSTAGYPATVDRHEDVMGGVWFRAMAGPYSSRDKAEVAARSLGARYGYKPWILTVEETEEVPAIPADTLSDADRSAVGLAGASSG